MKRLFLLPAEVVVSLLLASMSFGAVELQTLVSFGTLTGPGSQPIGPLVKGNDGNYYGTTSEGATNLDGGVFKITPAGRFTPVTSFTDDIGTGVGEGLVLGSDGNFYGTLMRGGTFGTIYKMTPRGKVTTFAEFDGTNGWVPVCLIAGTDGNFYGTAWHGGGIVNDGLPSGNGTVFKVTADGELTKVFAFDGTNGDMPIALIQGTDGNLYGLTENGGPGYDPSGFQGEGTAFKLTTNGVLTTLCAFTGENGFSPNALLQGADGNLYGTTSMGGTNFSNGGTVFRLSTDGQLTTLHMFSDFVINGQNSDGVNPVGRLLQGKDGCLYGGTRNGGTNLFHLPGYGTFYKITTNGELFTLRCLDGGSSPLQSYGPMPNGLIQDQKGDFFGTTFAGGSNNMGSLVKLVDVPPILAITKHTSGPTVTISGKAKTKFGASIINVFCRLNDGDWTNCTTTDGFAHWSANVTLLPGKNIFRAYAVDSAGDHSRTNALRISFQGR